MGRRQMRDHQFYQRAVEDHRPPPVSRAEAFMEIVSFLAMMLLIFLLLFLWGTDDYQGYSAGVPAGTDWAAESYVIPAGVDGQHQCACPIAQGE